MQMWTFSQGCDFFTRLWLEELYFTFLFWRNAEWRHFLYWNWQNVLPISSSMGQKRSWIIWRLVYHFNLCIQCQHNGAKILFARMCPSTPFYCLNSTNARHEAVLITVVTVRFNTYMFYLLHWVCRTPGLPAFLSTPVSLTSWKHWGHCSPDL